MKFSSEHSTEQLTSGMVWRDAGPNFMPFNPSGKDDLGNRHEKQKKKKAFCKKTCKKQIM